MSVPDRSFAKGKLLHALVLGLLVVLAPAAPAAQDATAVLRERALSDLQSADAAARTEACGVLAETGGQSDLPPLMAALHDSDGAVRQAAEQAIWRVWSRSGDAAADRVFAAGLAQMQAGDLKAAVESFGRVIRMKPEFAEGWNKRATVHFLLGENELSLRDCDEVIKRNPRHFGVLAGYGQIHVRKGDLAKALDYFERALAINPNMDGVRDAIDAIGRILAERQKRYI
jgi:tetratricopeptide (TPR) repeat protein